MDFVFDPEKIEELQLRIDTLYQDCTDCPVNSSCVRGCPDVCVVEEPEDYPIKESLRCQINRLLYKSQQENHQLL
jgi:sulfatase maturation enzyme AslB (radical SAM superfamily)